jgi:hypothetical protein
MQLENVPMVNNWCDGRMMEVRSGIRKTPFFRTINPEKND